MTEQENQPNNLVIVHFTAYDKKDLKEVLFNKTPEQAVTYIFKHICNTAIIERVRVIEIRTDEELTVFRRSMNEKEPS